MRFLPALPSIFRKTAALSALAVLFIAPAAFADSTLDSTQRIFSRAIRDTKDKSLGGTPEASTVIATLRTAKDKALLPFFEKLRQSKSLDNQIYAMMSIVILTHDPQKVDLPLLFSCDDQAVIGSGIGTLITNDVITVAQLEKVAADAPQEYQRAMAIGELSSRKALADRSILTKMLKNSDDVVRVYTAMTILETKDSPDTAEALAVLKAMSDKHNLRQAATQASMIVRAQKQKIVSAGPWIVQVASDEKNDEGLRYTAVSALLTMQNPEGPRILADMIQKQKEISQQTKLGLISLEGAASLKPAMLAPLAQSQAPVVRELAQVAQQGAGGGDVIPGLIKVIQLGHPIVADWTLSYSERADPSRWMQIRKALIEQARVVDDVRERDFERAAIAAERILMENGEEGRKLIATLLKSDNRAIVEAVLAGIYRAAPANEAELVLPVWEALSKSTTQEKAANYAALILARQGRQEPVAWLSGMVLGGTVQNVGFRALAGWYYAKLQGYSDALLKQAISE